MKVKITKRKYKACPNPGKNIKDCFTNISSINGCITIEMMYI